MTHNQFTSFKIMNSDFGNTMNVDLWSIGECIFCRGKIDEDSKILNCLHIICKDCAVKKRIDIGVQCKCKMVTKGELIDYLIMPPNKSQVKVCCEKNCQVVAKKICMHCKSVYCKPCSKTHSIKNEDHNPELMMTYPLKKEFVSCPECMEKCVEVFCTRCFKMICGLCHLMHHEEHNYKLLKKMGIETKAEFQSLLNDVSEGNHHFYSLIQMSDENIEKLKSEKKKIHEELDETFNMLYAKMNERYHQQRKTIETKFTDAVNSINIIKEVFNGFIKENDYYHSVTSSVINHNNTFQHIKLSKIIKDRVVVAKINTSDMLEEAKNCRYELKFNGEQSIKKCVESIEGTGNIILSPIVNLSKFKKAVDSYKALRTLENDQSSSLRSVEPGIIQSSSVKVEKVNNETIDEDSSDYEPLVSCSCCNQWTEELISCVCCDRFYHNDCHIPPLPEELTPKETSILRWKCTLCHEVSILNNDIANHNGFISSSEKKLIERILMELYCQNEDSEHYRECLNREMYPQYYEKVKDPISLNIIKERFESNSPYYKSLVDVLKDLRKVFLNGQLYYETCDHPYYKSAEELEISLDRMISSWIPTLDRAIL